MSPALPPGREPAPDTTEDWSDRRADARRNHERVFAAALEVFAERGLEATIPEIADRAGVGKATVYRSYPTKSALVEAVARHRLAWLTDRVAATAAFQDDAFAALQDLLGDIAERLASDRLLVDVLAQAKRWREENFTEPFSRLLEDAKRQGRIRSDATSQDVQVLVGGSSRVLLELDIRDPAQWRRYSTLALNALRP